jgi:hypothetical protein
MSYPFLNKQRAQTGSSSYDRHGDQYGGYDHSRTEMREDNSYYVDDQPSPIEKDRSAATAAKMNSEGSSPYGPRQGNDAFYASNTIWSRDDKTAMRRRSVPVKLIRVLACLVLNAIIVIISIVSLVVIFARPVNVGIGNVQTPSSSSVGLSGNAITFNGSVQFIVSNPNSISSDLSISAKVYDVVNTKTDIGRGSIENSKIGANSNTTINFPYQVRYDPTADSDKSILSDLASKCGLSGGSGGGDLELTLDIDAKVKILSVPVPVKFSQPVSFACPISADLLKNIGGGSLLNSILGGLSGRSHSEL